MQGPRPFSLYFLLIGLCSREVQDTAKLDLSSTRTLEHDIIYEYVWCMELTCVHWYKTGCKLERPDHLAQKHILEHWPASKF